MEQQRNELRSRLFLGVLGLALCVAVLIWRGCRAEKVSDAELEAKALIAQDFEVVSDRFYRPKIYRHHLLKGIPGPDREAPPEELMVVVTSDGEVGFAGWTDAPKQVKMVVGERVFATPCGRLIKSVNGFVEFGQTDFFISRGKDGLLQALTEDAAETYLFRLGKDDERVLGFHQAEALRKSIRLAHLMALLKEESR